MTLGQFIKNYRDEHDMSMRTFAKQCCLSVQYVSLLERGKNNYGKKMSATMDTYSKIAEGIGMSINDLLGMINDNICLKDPAPSEAETDSFSESEIALIEKYRSLTLENQIRINERIDIYLEEQKKEDAESLSSAV